MELFTEKEFDEFFNNEPDYKRVHLACEMLIYKAVEETLKALPQIVSHLLQHSSVMKNATDKFYNDNHDLIDHKEIVAKTIEEIETEFPGKTLSELMNLAAPEARRRIKEVEITNNIPRMSTKDLDNSLGNI